MEALDAGAIRFNLFAPYPGFLAPMTASQAELVSSMAWEAGTLDRVAVGTGPYRFVEWVSGKRLVMETIPDYWRGEERAVVLSLEAYRRLTRREETALRAFLRASPWADVELELERVADPPSEIDLADEADALNEAATNTGDVGAATGAVDHACDR